MPAASCNRRTKAGPKRNRDEARRELNRAYDRFVAAYGPINKTTFGETADGSVIRRMPNLVKFREDPDAMLVMSLEDYDEVTGKAAKAAIMTKDVVGKTPPITSGRAAPRKGCWSPSTNAARSICRSSARSTARPKAGHCRAGRPDLPRPGIENLADRRRLSVRQRARQARRRRSAPARHMPAMSRPCGQCSPRTCCPATSTPISAPRGYRRATSRHSPPTCSTSIHPAFPSPT